MKTRPRFFALQVLQYDRFGGGTLSVMNVQHLSEPSPRRREQRWYAPST